MPSADQYAAWIVKNADKKGTPEFDTVAKAYRAAKTGIQVAPTTQDAAPIAAEEPSFMRSVGKSVRDLAAGAVRGAGSIGATIVQPGDMLVDYVKGDRQAGLTNLVTGKEPESRNEERRRKIDEGLRTMTGSDTDSMAYGAGKLGAEIAGTLGVGGAAGNALLRVAPKAVPLANALATGGFRAGTAPGGVNLLTRAVGGSVAGGASAGLIDPKLANTGAVIGGALPVAGVAAGKVAGKAGEVVGNAIRGGSVSPEVKALAERAKQLGIDIPADRLVNSRPLNAVTSGLNYVPFSGRAATEDKMVRQLTKAATRLIGQDSDNMAQALRKASDDLGAKFDSVLTGNSVNIDKQFATDLAEISNSASRELGADGLKAISGQIDELVAKGANGSIDGQAAYNIKRTLDRIGKRNAPEAFHALELKRALMGALDRSLGPTEAAAFAKTRQQYGNMIALDKIAKNGVEGDISVARLANMQNINNKDLQEIADIAAQFVKAREGQHGAMQRAVAGIAAGSVAGLPTLAGGAVAGRGVNMLLNSQAARNYVTQTPGAVSIGANKLTQKIAPTIYRAAPVTAYR